MGSERAFEQAEDQACSYPLPELLKLQDGSSVISPAQWQQRRDELLAMFAKEVYGRTPTDPVSVSGEIVEQGPALQGSALRQQIQLTVEHNGRTHRAGCLLYRPSHVSGPVPLFLGLNFHGNHTISEESAVAVPDSWRSDSDRQLERGAAADRWSIEHILEAGFAVATMYCGDWAPDDIDHWQEGAWQLFTDSDERQPDQWAAIGIWAWGLSRALDYFGTDPAIASDKVTAIGHSRMGKTALWAGAQDPRIAAVISNASGCGGAAISRRRIGETVQLINERFPYWFCENFKKYNEREEHLPIDQHMLLALAAPRPLYVASADDDVWADPRGEFLGLKATEPVYKLWSKQGLQSEEVPPTGDADRLGSIGYHIRAGKHGITAFDWQQYTAFVRLHLG